MEDMDRLKKEVTRTLTLIAERTIKEKEEMRKEVENTREQLKLMSAERRFMSKKVTRAE